MGHSACLPGHMHSPGKKCLAMPLVLCMRVECVASCNISNLAFLLKFQCCLLSKVIKLDRPIWEPCSYEKGKCVYFPDLLTICIGIELVP